MRPKRLTKEERRGEDAFELNKKIIENENLIRRLSCENSRFFTEIYDRQLYKDILGDEDAEWSGFLSQVEVYRTRNEVYRLVKIYKKYELELGINLSEILDVPMTRLYDLIKFVNSENVHEMLSKARVLTSDDWRIFLREKKNLPIENDCKHDFVEYQICRICGEKHKTGQVINEVENEKEPIQDKVNEEV